MQRIEILVIIYKLVLQALSYKVKPRSNRWQPRLSSEEAQLFPSPRWLISGLLFFLLDPLKLGLRTQISICRKESQEWWSYKRNPRKNSPISSHAISGLGVSQFLSMFRIYIFSSSCTLALPFSPPHPESRSMSGSLELSRKIRFSQSIDACPPHATSGAIRTDKIAILLTLCFDAVGRGSFLMTISWGKENWRSPLTGS